MPVVAESHGQRVLDLVRWGLVPSWAKDLSIGDRLINARAETVLTSNAFKRAFDEAPLHHPRRRLLRVAEVERRTRRQQAAVVLPPARR